MSKVTMPEPSAEITSMNNVTVFDLTAHGKRSGLSVGEKFITTTQAEAYADARVREALEAAAAVAEKRSAVLPHYSDFIRGYADGRKAAASEIRALMPPMRGVEQQ